MSPTSIFDQHSWKILAVQIMKRINLRLESVITISHADYHENISARKDSFTTILIIQRAI